MEYSTYVNFLDEGDGITYSHGFDDNDVIKLLADWKGREVKLDSIGGSFRVVGDQITIMYESNGGMGSICSSYSKAVEQLKDPKNRVAV